MDIKWESWGVMPDGTEVKRYTLVNDMGMHATFSTLGATLVGLTVPNGAKALSDVVLGYDTFEEYLEDQCFFGCMVGRVANRVGNARFTLDGITYDLDRNHGEHHLHGGSGGLHARAWEAETFRCDDGPGLSLRCVSDDGDQGYPGTLDITVTYTLMPSGLRLECRATTDKPTPVNLTNHTYFNLAGKRSNVLDHLVTIDASRFLMTDSDQIPTGMIADCVGTPLDFSRPDTIGRRIDEPFDSLRIGHGYDQYFIIDGEEGALNHVAQVCHAETGRVLDVWTTQPGVQFYSGNHLPERVRGKLGTDYGFRSGFCLETQGYTDAVNHPEFPSTILSPGETYEQVTEYRFSLM